MLVQRTSIMTGVTHVRDLPITEDQLRRHQDGEYIQTVFPDLSASDREFIMTGITDEEWNDAFGEEEE